MSVRIGVIVLTSKEQQLLDALTPKANAEGVELVTIEVVGSKKAPTIRLFIDTENGVSFDELTSAQAWINEIMDRLDPFPGAYTLEVSSPGIDRPLRTPAHFERFIGKTAVVKTSGAINGRSSFTGTIESVTEEAVSIRLEDDVVAIPFKVMKRAHLQGEIEFK